MELKHKVLIRAISLEDYEEWLLLWKKYTTFYEYEAFPDNITQCTWNRFFDINEPVYGLVAECNNQLVGFTHYLFHCNTWQIELDCYLQDLYVDESMRGLGIARQLIENVSQEVKQIGINNLYWQTHETNTTARLLYDKLAKFSGFIVYSKSL